MGLFAAANAWLALGSAVLWGIGDFSGGMGVKQAGGSFRAALRFVIFSHLASLGVLIAIALCSHTAPPRGSALVWGLAAGISGGLALVTFYSALVRGAMGAAAAVSGLLAAALPALLSALIDGLPGMRRAAGFAVAALAIWMIGGSTRKPGERTTALLAIAAGAGFGLYFIALRFASPAGPVWSMATARVGSIATCGLILLALGSRGGTATVTRRVLPWIFLTALFDTAGNLFFVAATRAGRLDVAAVLASLYPASTILLAAVVLHERPSRRQALGMAMALAAVVLVTL